MTPTPLNPANDSVEQAAAKRPPRVCLECGCTNDRACPGGCGWVWANPKGTLGLCSTCWFRGQTPESSRPRRAHPDRPTLVLPCGADGPIWQREAPVFGYLLGSIQPNLPLAVEIGDLYQARLPAPRIRYFQEVSVGE